MKCTIKTNISRLKRVRDSSLRVYFVDTNLPQMFAYLHRSQMEHPQATWTRMWQLSVSRNKSWHFYICSILPPLNINGLRLSYGCKIVRFIPRHVFGPFTHTAVKNKPHHLFNAAFSLVFYKSSCCFSCTCWAWTLCSVVRTREQVAALQELVAEWLMAWELSM